jgi:ribonucleoside-diphosphate reductase beta chain
MKKSIYNPDSKESVSDRQIISGNPTGIAELSNIKYNWAKNLFKLQMENTWFPEEVSTNDDQKDYKTLTKIEKNSYDKALSQLIFMDSIQTNNLTDNINPYITAPEVNLCVVRQAFEESLHSHSYAVLVDGISQNSDEIYQLWRTEPRLKSKNDHIAKVYDDLAKNPNEENLVLAFVANQILEGIYFYSGFAYIYALSRNGKMHNSAQMIKFIHRDEVTHLLIYQNIINTLKRERPELFTKELELKIVEMFKNAVELESAWGEFITEGRILGLTPALIKEFVQYLADKRLEAIGYEPLYNIKKHPISWFKDFENFNDSKANFFESNVVNYSKKKTAVTEDAFAMDF